MGSWLSYSNVHIDYDQAVCSSCEKWFLHRQLSLFSVLVICIMGINDLFTKYVNVIITYDIFAFCGIMAIDTVFLEFYHVRLISCVPHCQLLD